MSKMGELRKHSRIIYVDMRLIVEILNTMRSGQYIALPDIPEIPEDTEVIGVFHEFARRAFAVMLSHPSFGEVPEGEMIPELVSPAIVEWNTFRRLDSPYVGVGQTFATAGEKIEPGQSVYYGEDGKVYPEKPGEYERPESIDTVGKEMKSETEFFFGSG